MEEVITFAREDCCLQIPALRELVDDLPKTETGKILKRELTDSGKVERDAAALALGS